MNSDDEEYREELPLRRVVLDTNVLVSAFQFGGKPRKLLELALAGSLIPLGSVALKDKLLRILIEKFKVPPSVLKLATKSYWEAVLWIEPTETVTLCRDEADNRVLECALAGKADYIVTGDRDLLDLAAAVKIPILKPDSFLTCFYQERRKPNT
jgi:putative PIN family toxin of toxin-antitoxin system